MSDEDLRALQRRWYETGATTDLTAWVTARQRAGEILTSFLPRLLRKESRESTHVILSQLPDYKKTITDLIDSAQQLLEPPISGEAVLMVVAANLNAGRDREAQHLLASHNVEAYHHQDLAGSWASCGRGILALQTNHPQSENEATGKAITTGKIAQAARIYKYPALREESLEAMARHLRTMPPGERVDQTEMWETMLVKELPEDYDFPSIASRFRSPRSLIRAEAYLNLARYGNIKPDERKDFIRRATMCMESDADARVYPMLQGYAHLAMALAAYKSGDNEERGNQMGLSRKNVEPNDTDSFAESLSFVRVQIEMDVPFEPYHTYIENPPPHAVFAASSLFAQFGKFTEARSLLNQGLTYSNSRDAFVTAYCTLANILMGYWLEPAISLIGMHDRY